MIRRAAVLLLLATAAWLPAAPSRAGFTETLPYGAFMVDLSYMLSELDSAYDNRGRRTALVEPIERYEPGGGLQGVLTPKAAVQYQVLVAQIQYGILDNLTFGVGVPIVLQTVVNPHFQWSPGDYQSQLGRSYSQQDFWEWAKSMGQPKPTTWRGNEGVLGDVILGARFRFSDYAAAFDRAGVAMSLLATVALPTGQEAAPEQILAAGTTSWDLHSNGDFGLHLAIDKSFKSSLDGRLILGFEGFHEFWLPHRYDTPSGTINPLLLDYRPYVGAHYTIIPGDFTGASAEVDVVAVKCEARGTWITKGDAAKADALPPLMTLTFRYTFVYLQQTVWKSESEIWDWEREKLWRPGYKNMLYGQALFSLLRYGAPVQPYIGYRNMTWIPGKNCRAADVYSGGLRTLVKFW